VDVVDNRGVIIMTFYRAIGWRKAGDQGEEDNGSGTLMVSITGDQNGKGGVMGHVCFLGKKGEAARRLHGIGDGRHNEEQHGGRGGRRWWLASVGRR
jgi:hypothetical protein